MEELKSELATIQDDFNLENKIIQINYNQSLTLEQFATIESIRKIRNPFIMISVEDVMKDLKICKTIAYRLFQREDFPSINVGKSNQVMLISYIVWKMNKRK